MTEESPPKKSRSTTETIGVVAVVALTSVVTFGAVFALGAWVGVHISAGSGPVNEHHLANGIMTGLIAGGVSGMTVAVLLFRKSFR